MSSRTITMTPALEDYVLRVGAAEPEVLRLLREQTAALPDAQMQIGPDQGRLMRWLVELIGARRCLEIGVYTGYSSTVVALGMPSDGLLVACDIDPQVTQIAQRYWNLAGVANKIRLELRPARETLETLLRNGHALSFDFVFIDADKAAYDYYYETCLQLVRKDGLILLDNTLWSGQVLAPAQSDHDGRSIAALNEKLSRDERVSASMLAIGDGVTLVRKR